MNETQAALIIFETSENDNFKKFYDSKVGKESSFTFKNKRNKKRQVFPYLGSHLGRLLILPSTSFFKHDWKTGIPGQLY
jgi:hypothetical protein